MFSDSITVGRLFGIRFSVSASWFVIFFLVTFSLGGVYFPHEFPRWPPALYWGAALLASLLFFACVVLHELAHSLVALREKVPVRSITLFLFGGVSHIGRDAPSPAAEFKIALAGPLASIALGLLAGGLFFLLRGRSEAGAAICFWLAGVNGTLGLFNLLPGFPLDGGRLLRAAVWFAGEDYRWATRVATRAGQLAALTMIMAGIYLLFSRLHSGPANGFWLIFVGWFLLTAANASYQQVQLVQTLDGVRVSDVMRRPPSLVDEADSPGQALELSEADPGPDPLVVLRAGAPVGLLDPAVLTRLDPARLATSHLADLMRPLEPGLALTPDLPAGQALQTLVEHGEACLPVLADGAVVGLVRRDDLFHLVELRRRRGR